MHHIKYATQEIILHLKSTVEIATSEIWINFKEA